MKIALKNSVKKFQMGGEIAPEEAAPQGGDPMTQLMDMAAQAVQNQDCQMAMQVCAALLQAAQGAAAEAPQEEPVFAKNGCKVVKKIKKSKCKK